MKILPLLGTVVTMLPVPSHVLSEVLMRLQIREGEHPWLFRKLLANPIILGSNSPHVTFYSTSVMRRGLL